MAEIYTPYLVVTSGKASQLHENLKTVLICILANNNVYTKHAVIIIASTSDSTMMVNIGACLTDRHQCSVCSFNYLPLRHTTMRCFANV